MITMLLVVPILCTRSANLEKDLTTSCVIFFFGKKTLFVAGMKLTELLKTSFFKVNEAAFCLHGGPLKHTAWAKF